MEDSRNVKPGAVVRVRAGHSWARCLVTVEEVRTWGVQGYVTVPEGGDAPIRLGWADFDVIGEG